jgi:hypothetical protein
MLIREINKRDVTSLMRLAHFFWQESLMGSFSKFPEDNVYRVLFNNLSSGNIVGWGIEKENQISCGVIFLKGQNFWSSAKQLNEIAWFNEKNSRFGLSSVKLIKIAEIWAKENGYTFISMGRIKGPPSYSKLPRLYSRMGYKNLEETFIKKL